MERVDTMLLQERAARIEKLEAQLAVAREVLPSLISIVEAIVDNDPDDLVADGGITVLDACRQSAQWALGKARAALQQTAPATDQEAER